MITQASGSFCMEQSSRDGNQLLQKTLDVVDLKFQKLKP